MKNAYGQELHHFGVSCVACGRGKKVWAADFEKAFGLATAQQDGWTWRWSKSGEHAELLCFEHADLPTGVYI